MPFLNTSQFSDEDILSRLTDRNNLTLDANINVLTFGRQAEDHRFSVELNLRAGL
jgi:hypothetical protein